MRKDAMLLRLLNIFVFILLEICIVFFWENSNSLPDLFYFLLEFGAIILYRYIEIAIILKYFRDLIEEMESYSIVGSSMNRSSLSDDETPLNPTIVIFSISKDGKIITAQIIKATFLKSKILTSYVGLSVNEAEKLILQQVAAKKSDRTYRRILAAFEDALEKWQIKNLHVPITPSDNSLWEWSENKSI